MMTEYKLPATFFAKGRIRVLVWALLISGIAAAAGIRIGMAWIAVLGVESHLPSSFLFIIVVVVLTALIVGVKIGFRRVQRSWASYRLILDENSIRRVQVGYPEVTIQSGEIARIIETEGRGLVVHSVTPYTHIGIPFALEDYSEVRSELAKKHAIEKISRARGKLTLVLVLTISLLIPVALVVTFLATNKYVIVMTGISLCFVLLVTEVGVQRSSSISQQMKRSSWLVFLLLLAVALRVLFVILNW